MFQWYAEAIVCYVYLHDLKLGSSDILPYDVWRQQFRLCKWFTRGWTLQELIAPLDLYFHDADWVRLGSLRDLVEDVSVVTKIGVEVLQSGSDGIHRCRNPSGAKRMSWAAGRETTRIEDRAYSLLGIFEVNMPLLVRLAFAT